jgi:hypothetical protein
MFIGEGRAGKTSTFRVMLGLSFQKEQPSTRGVDMVDVDKVRAPP